MNSTKQNKPEKQSSDLKSRGFSGAAHAELIQIGLAHHNPTQVLDLLDGRRIERRAVAPEDAGPTGGGHVGGADVVLDADENPGEGSDILVPEELVVEEAGLAEDVVVGGDVEEGADVGLGAAEAGKEALGELDGGELAGEERVTGGEDLGGWVWVAGEGAVGDGL
ncbi:hypothetical protein TIFTF001_023994 [Ficus carica]|uniref:Uncharacterized protein n=1 Tax=Ficus carica TaxID=3494 RepID=A0AA88B0E2_FICCA|nr:hypothetical protein TIFTF001_023994 [Ficus carica]